MSTSGAETAPRCLYRKARFVPNADSAAQPSPRTADAERSVAPDNAPPGSRARCQSHSHIPVARTSYQRVVLPWSASRPDRAPSRMATDMTEGVEICSWKRAPAWLRSAPELGKRPAQEALGPEANARFNAMREIAQRDEPLPPAVMVSVLRFQAKNYELGLHPMESGLISRSRILV